MRIIQAFLILTALFLINEYNYAGSLLSTVRNIEQRPFSLSANNIRTWKKDGIRIFVAQKDARILQGPFQITADTVVCWFHEAEAVQRTEATVEVYCEGGVTILQGENYEKYEQVYLRFETMTGVVVNPDIQPIETFEEAQEMEVVLRGEEIRLMKKDEYLSTEIPRKVPISGVSRKEEMVDIIADSIDSWEEGDRRIVVALGNVEIKKEDMTIDADSVILWFEKKESDSSKYSEQPLCEIYAEGNVTMRRKDDIQIADKIFEDVKEDKGILINSKIKTVIQQQKKTKISDSSIKPRSKKDKTSLWEGMPAYVSGEEIKHVAKGQYEIKNGTISTCGYGHPHYHFKGKRIRLVQRDIHNILSSTNNAFYLGKYPVAYLPYLSLDVRKRERILKDWQFGSSSRFGSFLKTDWDLFAVTGGKQKEWSDLTVNLDYLEKRGVGTGLDFEYKGEDLVGYVNTYYIKDQGDFDINDIPIEQEDRGTILWRHRQELPYDWRLDMEYSYLSDPRFLREFFEHEFKQEKDRETVLYLRRIHDTTAETFLINEQFNGFDTTVGSLREKRYAERLPEAAYRIIGEPIADNLFIFTSESSATYFDGSFDQSEVTELDSSFTGSSPGPSVEPQSVTRVDTVNRISMPFKPWFFNINPFVEGRATGYTESIDTSGSVDEANGPATGRFIGSLGFDWSSTHWRSYSVYNDFLKINRLRHIFVPELRYIYSPVVTEDPNELYQHDAIDALDSSQVAVIGIKNKLQTKRGEPGFEKTVDFVDFNVDYYMFPTSAGLFNDGINGIIIRRDNFINIDFRSQLTDIVAFVSERNEFNTDDFQFDVLTSGFEISNPPDWQYFIGHRFIRDISSTIILGADYTISEKWRIMAVEKYDFRSLEIEDGRDRETENKPKNLKTNFVLSRYFHDWVGSITLELDPVRNDSSYRFDITPRGLEKRSRRFWF
ncbi:MAG: LPS-assembly protein LptD [Candidatus Brocadia sp.]|nr:LPS-assembly protein LptD [Candidatus Brocadia sp.]